MHKDSKESWLGHLAADRRYAAMTGLGFSSGLPFLLVYSTQSAWLSEAGVPIETIGLLSELTIAYKFKFVWSPFLDKYDPPAVCLFRRAPAWLDHRFADRSHDGVGRRRFWRPRALDRVDRHLFAGSRLRWRYAGRDHRRLAHHGGAARQAIAHDCLFGGGLSRRHARCRRRHAHRRRPLRLAHGLYVHGRVDDHRRAIRLSRARARIRSSRASRPSRLHGNHRRAD